MFSWSNNPTKLLGILCQHFRFGGNVFPVVVLDGWTPLTYVLLLKLRLIKSGGRCTTWNHWVWTHSGCAFQVYSWKKPRPQSSLDTIIMKFSGNLAERLLETFPKRLFLLPSLTEGPYGADSQHWNGYLLGTPGQPQILPNWIWPRRIDTIKNQA